METPSGVQDMVILNYYCLHCGWSGIKLTPECEINKPEWICCPICGGKALLVYPEKVEIKADKLVEVEDNNDRGV